MKLNYRLGTQTDWLFYPGNLPYPKMEMKKVKLSFPRASADTHFPFCFGIGEFLTRSKQDTSEFAISLLLTYQAGTTPPTAKPLIFASVPDDGSAWESIPNSPILGQVRVALNQEAIDQIKPIEGEGYEYELSLDNVQFQPLG